MHQCVYRSRYKAIDDEKVLLNAESRIKTFEVSRTVGLDTMAQHEVLSARWRPDRVGLDKAQPVKGTLQCSGRKQAAGDGKAPQVIEGDHHNQSLPKT